ncbi:hypothetical protein SAOR_07055 [Salinisphaera orenii MK-B5]|uniref:Uncharacterized protein n=1 Tax=Salinisphaera orenii MK-B5 TaxID=856730 RepID=A0A423PQN8_9GAMM|nr:hypothetical protein SAOR_07055 [Salinisphaera orenii MK-B5]
MRSGFDHGGRHLDQCRPIGGLQRLGIGDTEGFTIAGALGLDAVAGRDGTEIQARQIDAGRVFGVQQVTTARWYWPTT